MAISIVDLRGALPRVTGNDPYPLQQEKTSLTVHYQGVDVDLTLPDDRASLLIKSDALGHIRRDWGNGQGGGGVMYHEMIAPSGTVFITRDPDDYLWHCGSDFGNRHSRAIQVMCGPATPPTPAQLTALEARIVAHGLPVKGHRDWSPTQCPGQEVYVFLQGRGGVAVAGEQITREEFEAYKRAMRDTIEAMKAAYDPLVRHDHPLAATGRTGKAGES